MENEEKKESNFEILDVPDKDKVTDSQIARLNKQTDIKNNLLGFIDTTIHRLEDKDSVKNTLLTMMGNELANANPGEITLPMLAKTYEILSKADNELALGLFDLIKSAKKDLLDTLPSDKVTEVINDNLNKDDIFDVKELLDGVRTMKKIKLNEFTEGEKG
jgi:hypothetical protein